MCVLCVQRKAEWQGKLSPYSPTTSGGYSRERLEREVQDSESLLQRLTNRLPMVEQLLLEAKGESNRMTS